jgi:hypothetical protein
MSGNTISLTATEMAFQSMKKKYDVIYKTGMKAVGNVYTPLEYTFIIPVCFYTRASVYQKLMLYEFLSRSYC